jgi:acyl-CoA thioester hydrolase
LASAAAGWTRILPHFILERRFMSHVSTIDFRVRYAETDQMGVVYHANYLVWCELGRTEFIRQLGVTYAELERSGVMLAVSEATIRFHAGARYDDLIRVTTTLPRVRSRMITFDYDVRRLESGDRLVTASTTLVCLDAASRPMALPTELRRGLEALVTPAAEEQR